MQTSQENHGKCLAAPTDEAMCMGSIGHIPCTGLRWTEAEFTRQKEVGAQLPPNISGALGNTSQGPR